MSDDLRDLAWSPVWVLCLVIAGILYVISGGRINL